MPDNKQAEEAATSIPVEDFIKEVEKRYPLNMELEGKIGKGTWHDYRNHVLKQRFDFMDGVNYAASLHSAELERVRKERDEFAVKFLDWVGNGFVKNDSTDCWIEFMENGTRWEYTTEQLLQQFKNQQNESGTDKG
jgi:hypothetical protein